MNFKVFLFIGVILCVNQNVLSLEEDDFEITAGMLEFSEDLVIQYEKMLESSREEMRVMINTYNALTVSRMGFVATEMMDIQNTVNSSIQQRALEINSITAQCIVDATSELEYIVSNAGPSFAEVSGQINSELMEVSDFLFFPFVDDIHEMVSDYETNLFLLFAIYNQVTEFQDLIYIFLYNVLLFDRIFEEIVEEIYIEMVFWNIIMDDVSAVNFPILQSSLDYYRFNANLIENTLGDCNADEIEV